MKYEIAFEHPETGEQRSITVELTADEIAKTGHGIDLFRHAFALKRGYKIAPRGFLHTAVREVTLQ